MESFLICIPVSDKLNEPNIPQTDVQVQASPERAALHFVSKPVNNHLCKILMNIQ